MDIRQQLQDLKGLTIEDWTVRYAGDVTQADEIALTLSNGKTYLFELEGRSDEDRSPSVPCEEYAIIVSEVTE